MEKRENNSKIITIFFIIALFWILIQFIAPIILPKGSVTDLSGLTGLEDNEQQIKKMNSPISFIYSAGDRLCHQKASRSFFINENQMPFCARCTAIWLGITIGIGFMLFYKIPLDEKFFYLMMIGLIPIGIDGVGQLLGFWESTNLTRVITGLFIGVITGFAVVIIIDELKNIINKKNKN
jgi:uncharacterized membrane protein